MHSAMIPLLSNGNFLIPAFGMGSWCFGGRTERALDNNDDGQIAALRAGIDAGITLIDTAEYYAAGYAETLIGKAIAPYERSKIFLTSKVWKTHLRYADTIVAAENSLRRLGTDYLDLYLYHQIDDAVPLSETMDALNELVSRGLVHAIGVSNFAPARLEEAMKCSSAPVALNQVQYNLAVREAELAGLPQFCLEHKVILQAWRPVRDLVPCALTEKLCRKYGITFCQLALAWLLNQRIGVLTAMRNAAHIPENLAACDVSLEKEDIELLRRSYPGQKSVSGVPLR